MGCGSSLYCYGDSNARCTELNPVHEIVMESWEEFSGDTSQAGMGT